MTPGLLRDYALRFVGKPYIWGGDDPIAGFDCSGLVIELLTAAGVFPYGYDAPSRQILIDLIARGAQKTSYPQFGSICFYGKNPDTITHVAFCMDKETIIEAGGGGSANTTAEVSIKTNGFVRFRPLSFRKDLLVICNPSYKFVGV